MSYNSYYKGGAPRGRGFGSRGSFRGRGGESGSGRGRGSSRGRFNWYKERSSGFESRSRYLSGGSGGGGGGGGSGRYSGGYRRFRGDDLDYPPRERYHRSPDVPRKRLRNDVYLQISEDEDDLIEGDSPLRKKGKKVKREKGTKKEEPEEGEEIEEEGDETDEIGGEKKVKEDKGNSEPNSKDKDSDAQSDDGDKPIFDLSCPHCFTQSDTVQEYKMHLYSSKHINAMRQQSLLHKQTLQRMRMNQRQKQRIVEESEEYRHTLSDRTKFCPTCKLNYKQPKSVHMTSEDHEEMVKFLNPQCRICKSRFSTPMFYEHHICSMDHIKFKAILYEATNGVGLGDDDDDEPGGKDDEKELNLDNFMILDSVGSVDGEEGESGGDEKAEKKEKEKDKEKDKEKEKETDTDQDKDKDKEKEKEKDKEGEEKKPKPKEINVGFEYMRKVEVFYCDLCRVYLPWYEDQQRAVSIHCRSRSHLQRYVRQREDKLFKKEAERVQQKKLAKRKAEKEARAKKTSEKKEQTDNKSAESPTKAKGDKDDKSSEDTAGESPKKKKSKGESADGTGEEQGQDQEMENEEDLDKEIGGILDVVEQGIKSSDEDDDSHGRYDRFQNSEKGSAALDANQSEEDVTKTTAVEEQAAEAEEEEEEEEEEEKPAESEPQSPTKKASAAESESTPTSAAD